MDREAMNHYYGDEVRTIFVGGGVIMLVTYPFFQSFISVPIWLSILGCIALAVSGGLMNPKQKWTIFLNTIISIFAFLSFEYYAVYAYLNLSPSEDIHVTFFWINQMLSLLFFFATYLSSKSLRGALVA